mmetsp:Transcript_5496/g.7212  ORF Transcript_5496/g.7212 Transcript_5496/m.7212 type:complete len:164 (+) Transcript_5496:43-534(+)|eukprot:CAMPEP_0195264622 /NCGR_PEP_ID=MMETSP0706-20130129/10962_1 /TAXON_ID=33640 /ORGANISM="Asterionellopsis glacialis, Strain CCMP134" /LENGTH=163 /DNA_ID=CAMNT_0040318933 /DNA_START=21 /DNA_END=512 /DNA_ORIENTATION=-
MNRFVQLGRDTATRFLNVAEQNAQRARTVMLNRGKHGVSAGKGTGSTKRRRRVVRSSNVIQSSHKSTTASASEKYGGLKPVNYSSGGVVPPIAQSPPPPPPRVGATKFAPLVVLTIFLGTSMYVYMNNKNDSYEYWRAMQTGQMVIADDDDDDDDDEDEDEEE